MIELNDSVELIGKISLLESKIAVIGLGYVGLPLAMTFAEAGFEVVGFDVDPEKVDLLNRAESYIPAVPDLRLVEAIRTAKFFATSDPDGPEMTSADVYVICVPTPLGSHQEPDMQYIEAALGVVLDAGHRGKLVVLESTTYPGTTDDLALSMLEVEELRAGKDFWLAYSPEREDPGNDDFKTKEIPKVMGGVDKSSTEIAFALYSRVFDHVVVMSSARAAEATKLLENVFRSVNIALVNELKVIFEKMGIDIWEVLDAADTKPFGFMRFNPGPGYGGHCIPCDPYYLSWAAKAVGTPTRFIELAGEINTQMPQRVVQKTIDAMNRNGVASTEADVLVVGVAYKPNVGDTRESPAYEVINGLLDRGCWVAYHDPYVPKLPIPRRHPDMAQMSSVHMTEDLLRDTDAVVIVTDHACLDYSMIATHAELIVDSRGSWPTERPKVVRV